ncbi:hypothetical protein VIN01S_07090 [Vibrio inusitatus NBRC 102082]|uniref:Uncharacterized protein n=1 Tax=Vibrio inusitatus NBRC 102082 TaxID=1219070 RepID=A0A4Y3HSB7_9VIBR|nr:hypothetical protein VIN01S_07090 [Vibrio inusitatus NBRC 102082]
MKWNRTTPITAIALNPLMSYLKFITITQNLNCRYCKGKASQGKKLYQSGELTGQVYPLSRAHFGNPCFAL